MHGPGTYMVVCPTLYLPVCLCALLDRHVCPMPTHPSKPPRTQLLAHLLHTYTHSYAAETHTGRGRRARRLQSAIRPMICAIILITTHIHHVHMYVCTHFPPFPLQHAHSQSSCGLTCRHNGSYASLSYAHGTHDRCTWHGCAAGFSDRSPHSCPTPRAHPPMSLCVMHHPCSPPAGIHAQSLRGHLRRRQRRLGWMGDGYHVGDFGFTHRSRPERGLRSCQ